MSDTPESPAPKARAGRPANARLRTEPVRPAPARQAAQRGEPRLTRHRRRVDDKFALPPEVLADMQARGLSYEFKRQSVYGETDPAHAVNLRENHWTPVPASRYPQLMPTDHSGPIAFDGMVLMERPAYLTEEARQEDYQIAVSEVSHKEAQAKSTPNGQFTRNHPSVQKVTRINRTVERMDIPSE